MAHALDGAFQRVNRASEHLSDLRRRIADLARACENIILANLDLKLLEKWVEPSVGIKPMPLQFEKSAPDPVRRTRNASGQDVYVQYRFSVFIAFADSTPVIQSLEVLKSSVAETLEAFKPEFE